jgi:hypothetical protein
MKEYAVAVIPADFLVGRWEIIEAPSHCVAAPESSVVPIRIIVAVN